MKNSRPLDHVPITLVLEQDINRLLLEAHLDEIQHGNGLEILEVLSTED